MAYKRLQNGAFVGGWSAVPNEIIDRLSLVQRGFYTTLERFADTTTGIVHATTSRLIKSMGISENTFYKIRKALEELKLITVTTIRKRTGVQTQIRLTDASESESRKKRDPRRGSPLISDLEARRPKHAQQNREENFLTEQSIAANEPKCTVNTKKTAAKEPKMECVQCTPTAKFAVHNKNIINNKNSNSYSSSKPKHLFTSASRQEKEQFQELCNLSLKPVWFTAKPNCYSAYKNALNNYTHNQIIAAYTAYKNKYLTQNPSTNQYALNLTSWLNQESGLNLWVRTLKAQAEADAKAKHKAELKELHKQKIHAEQVRLANEQAKQMQDEAVINAAGLTSELEKLNKAWFSAIEKHDYEAIKELSEKKIKLINNAYELQRNKN